MGKDRIKKGWNPQKIMESITAFANDINNWGGGYIIVGVDENEGRPLLPPEGIKISEVDKIQKQLLQECNRLKPPYFPIVEPIKYRE